MGTRLKYSPLQKMLLETVFPSAPITRISLDRRVSLFIVVVFPLPPIHEGIDHHLLMRSVHFVKPLVSIRGHHLFSRDPMIDGQAS
jgi:hypothetical protein